LKLKKTVLLFQIVIFVLGISHGILRGEKTGGAAGDTSKLGWIPFDDAALKGKMPQSYMKDETTMGTLVNFDIPGVFIHEVKVDGTVFHRLSIPGHAARCDVGKPELPIVGQIIEVPKSVNLSVEIFKSKFIELENYNVYPAQEPETDQTGIEKREFSLDEGTYLKDAYYPQNLSSIIAEDIGVIRGHRVIFLKVNPIQYNPVTRVLKAYSQIEVRLRFDRPAQIEPVDLKLKSEPFEEMLNAAILNYKADNRFARLTDEPGAIDRLINMFHSFYYKYLAFDDNTFRNDIEAGCDYLIITHGDFNKAENGNPNPIEQLKNWKQRKGLKTRVVDTADIPNGGTADGIKVYIRDAYKKWYPAPTYVLLVGDAEKIPTNYGEKHPDHNCTPIGTDLHYATVDGTDYFPDIFIGRLSVETLAETQTVVNKILDYEKQPPNDHNFYANASLIAIFEDIDNEPPPDEEKDPAPEDGIEDRIWIECMEVIRDYLQNNGYSLQRIYATSSGWPNDPNSNIPEKYQNGASLPADLQVNINPADGDAGFEWNGSDEDIIKAINGGRFLVTYRDHGRRMGWSFGFNTNDIGRLAYNKLTPVIFSIACNTGWFDNETDDPTEDLFPKDDNKEHTENNEECLCEEFLRRFNGGAVAIIGSTRVSWTGWNDFFMFGLHKAIWPDFSPAPPLDEDSYDPIPVRETGPLYRMGQIHTFGKVYMANAYADSEWREKMFEMYHLFGDPEMPVWTREPIGLSVDRPTHIGALGEQDFVVKVTETGKGKSVANAVVVLTRGDAIIAYRETNPAGIARFTLDTPGTGDLDITVTAHNYRPCLRTIEVTDSGGIINRLDPGNGPENQTFYVGGTNFLPEEKVRISSFGTPPQRTATDANGKFGQSGTNVEVTVPSPSKPGPVNVVAYGEKSKRYAVDVFQVRSANPIDLYLYSQWDSTTWHLHNRDNPTWNNPDIQLYDENNNPVSSNNLVVGNQYTVKANIHNDTDFPADNVNVTFKEVSFGVGQPGPAWSKIGEDTLDVPANSTREAEVKWAPPRTGHLCILAEIYHNEDINEENNKGQENCDVSPTSSPAKVPFLVYNPTDKPAALHLELRQILKSTIDQIWPTTIVHPDPQVIPPGESREAVVEIDPDKINIRPCQTAEFALTGFINGKVVGGANFIITKKCDTKVPPFGLSLHGGLTLPVKDFGSRYDSSFMLGLDIDYRITRRFSLMGFLGYNHFRAAAAAGNNTHWWNISGNLKFDLSANPTTWPYINGGIGLYIPKSGDKKWGFNLGCGLDRSLTSNLVFEIGLNYHHILTDEEDPEFFVGHLGCIFRF